MVIVDILAVPRLVGWRILHGDAGEVEHLTQQGHVRTQWADSKDLDKNPHSHNQ